MFYCYFFFFSTMIISRFSPTFARDNHHKSVRYTHERIENDKLHSIIRIVLFCVRYRIFKKKIEYYCMRTVKVIAINHIFIMV